MTNSGAGMASISIIISVAAALDLHLPTVVGAAQRWSTTGATTAGFGNDAAATWPPLSLGNNTGSLYGLAPRAFFYSACDRSVDDMYQWCDVFGGIGPSRQPTNDMYEAQQIAYPFAANVSTQSIIYLKITPPGCPTPRSGGAMVMLRSAEFNVSYGLIYGGADGDSTPLNDMHIYDYVDETWLSVTPPVNYKQLPPALMMHSMVATGGERFTVFFGASTTTGLSRNVYHASVDLSTMSVTKFQLINANATNAEDGVPGGRVGSCCVFHSGTSESMCFGGLNGVNVLGDTWIYGHVRLDWTLVSTIGAATPSPRFAAQCDYLKEGNAALLYGGFRNGSRFPVEDSRIYKFDFTTYTWTVFGDTAAAGIPVRGAGAMFVTNNGNTIEIVGGQGATDVLGDRWIVPVNSGSPGAATSLGVPSIVEVDSLVPEARQYHVSVALGRGFLIAFGLGSVLYNNVYFCANLTQSEDHQCAWVEVATAGSLSVPSPRHSLSGCAKGNVVYFFGGVTSLDGLAMSSELWTLTIDFVSEEVVTGVWKLITPSTSAATPPRARHQCVLIKSNLILVAGVVGAPTSLSGSVVRFNLQQQVWETLTVTPPLLPRASFGLHYNGSHAFLVGGVSSSLRGTAVLGDVIALVESETGDGSLLATEITVDQPVMRADAAVAGVANNIFVCGGALYASGQLILGAPVDMQCAVIAVKDVSANVRYYPMTRVNSFSRMVEAAGIGAAASIVGDQYMFFGGSITQDQTNRQDTYYDLTEAFYLREYLCTQEQLSAAGGGAYQLPCFHCGAGSRNPSEVEMASNGSCVLAPPGSYIEFGGQAFILCPAGRASSIAGATTLHSCKLCAEGSYAPAAGSTSCLPCPTNKRCPLGCSAPEAIVSTNSSVYQSQPPEMSSGSTPPLIFTAAGAIVAFLLLCLAIVTHFARSARRQRLHYFFNDAANAILREVYETYKRSHFGLDALRLRLALRDLGASRLPAEFVARVLAENDQTGAGHVTFTTLQEVVIAFIEKGLITAFPGTEQEANPGKALGRVKRTLSTFSFKDLDSYDTEHALGVEGEPIRIHSTVSGGVTRLLFNVLALGAALALIGQFVYTNVTETRAMTPSVNQDGPLVTTSLSMRVSATGGVLSQESCIVVTSNATTATNDTIGGLVGECLRGTGMVSVTDGMLYQDFTQTCTYDPAAFACVIAMTFTGCSLDFGQTVSVDVTFDSSVYAETIQVDVAADTGINDQANSGGISAVTGGWTSSTSTMAPGEQSSSGMIIMPSSQNNVFRGYPASTFTFPMLPTQFDYVDNIVLQNSITSSGYHVQLGSGSAGNTIDSSEITEYFGVPVTVTLVTDLNILVISRLPSATVLDFISQMLGSITGMGGILVALMQAYDAKFISRRHEKLQEELEDQALAGDDNTFEHNDTYEGADVFAEDGDTRNDDLQRMIKQRKNSTGVTSREWRASAYSFHSHQARSSELLDQELVAVNTTVQ